MWSILMWIILVNVNIYILLGAFFWNTGWYFLRVLKVFDEPLGESNTERRIKISAGISKEAPNNIFIVKLKNVTPGVKILEFKSNNTF